MKTKLSWKVLAVLTLAFWFIAKIVGGVIGDTVMLLVVITGALAVVDLLSPKKKATSE